MCWRGGLVRVPNAGRGCPGIPVSRMWGNGK